MQLKRTKGKSKMMMFKAGANVWLPAMIFQVVAKPAPMDL